jgi:hypothetical protein
MLLPDRPEPVKVADVLRRVIAALALLALASMPVVARTRLFCRYTGVEITGCQEQRLPPGAQVDVERCCDARTTHPTSIAPIGQQQASVPPLLIGLPVAAFFAAPPPRPPIRVFDAAPLVFLITRALLI